MGTNISLSIALGAGVLSFFTPCILSLMPVYMTYISCPRGPEAQQPGRLLLFVRTWLFVLGFSTVFLLLGLSAGFFGTFLVRFGSWLTRISGLVIILMGLRLLGVVRFPVRARKQQKNASSGVGEGSAYLLGLAFATGHSPCIGPVLGSILVYAAGTGTTMGAIALLGAYSLGMGLPFLVVSFFLREILVITGKARKVGRFIPSVSGILLILFGLLILVNGLV